MLDTLRKSTGSWIVKGLFVLLILSFGIWGVGDFLNSSSGQQAAIEVGDREISLSDFARTYKDQYAQQQRQLEQLGPNLVNPDLLRSLVLERTVQSLTNRALIAALADDLQIDVSTDVIRDTIRSAPQFQNPNTQKFDQARFEMMLRAEGYNEPYFISLLRGDLRQAVLVNTVTAGRTAGPEKAAEALYRFRAERREAQLVTVDIAAMPPPAAPDDAVLEASYKEREQQFMAPEYRAASIVVLDARALKDKLEVSDADVAAAYESYKSQYLTPESRTVVQMRFDDKEKADKALLMLQAGGSPEEVKAEFGARVQDLGAVNFENLPAEVGDAVFSVDRGETTEPVETALGWHLFTVTKVVPASVKSLDEVREDLRNDLKAERSIDALYRLSADVEDALGGGATLEEAAERLDLPLIRAEAMDRSGAGTDGQPITELPEGDAVLDKVFSMTAGSDPEMVETKDGYYFVRVDDVTASAVRPFASVRDQVLSLWQEDEKAKSAEAMAEAIKTTLESGTEIDIAAAGHPVATPKPFLRTGAADGMPAVDRSVAGQVFGLAQGGVAVAATADGYVVARLTRILPADPAAAPETVTSLSQEIARGIDNDLQMQLLASLYARYPVRINRPLIDSSF